MLKVQKMTLGSFMTNVYFIIDDVSKECLIADPADNAEMIYEKTSSQGLRISGILLTHAHFDHIMALEKLRDITSSPVMLAEAENELLCDPERNLMTTYGDGSKCRPGDVLLNEGDVIKLGNNSIDVIVLPGHTPGSCAYLFDDCMISGDTIFREGVGRYDFPGGDYFKLRESLKRLAQFEKNYRIFPGHGPSTTLEHEKLFNISLL